MVLDNYNTMKRILFILLIIISFIACTKKEKRITKKEDKVEIVAQKDSSKTVLPSNQRGLVKTDSVSVYIDILYKFYGHKDFYVPLYYKDQYTEELDDLLKNTNTKSVFKDEYSFREELDFELTKKHLEVSNLKKILVFNELQDQIDKLNLNSYERNYDGLYDFFVATYDTPNHKLEGKLIISSAVLETKALTKSPEVAHDSTLLKQLIAKNSYNATYVHGFSHFTVNKDTIAILSFGDYPLGKEALYLLKNGTPTDSIINDYAITALTPVPLATEYESRYIASCQVPDSDVSWTSLMGIDSRDYKFKFYDRNRINLKKL